MKKIFIFMFLLIPILSIGQNITQKDTSTKFLNISKTDSLLEQNCDLLESLFDQIYWSRKSEKYKLYQTENIYTLLQLNTKTGQIKQIQWSLEAEKEGEWWINERDLNGYEIGCFELYPTKNMYQFILLDKMDGRKWHVQWGFSESKRWIRLIW